MNKQMFLKAAILISFLGLTPVRAQTSDRPDGMWFIPDVLGKFLALRPSTTRRVQCRTRIFTPFPVRTRLRSR